MALSGCVNRSSEPAASRKRSFRLPQTHRAKRRGQPANPERRRYLRADSFSGSQEIKGKKRHILVDTEGLLLHAIVHAAGIQDRGGGVLLLGTLFGLFPFLKKLFAGSACQGPIFHKAVDKIPTQLDIEIVKRSGQAKGFVVPPKRWIAERTIAWLDRCRRLAKDWENLNVKALAFLRFASIRLMLGKLCNPS
jgi:transposase